MLGVWTYGGLDMSLRKSPAMTPARLEANRRNAQKSTGPRNAQGKAQSRRNGLRQGSRSAADRNLVPALMNAPLDSVNATANSVPTPEQAAHPVFADLVEEA